MKPRALICGVSGQDGAYLARLLIAHGYDVHGTSRDASAPRSNLDRLGIADCVTIHEMDPANPSQAMTAVRCVEPHEIYYLSAQSSVGRSFDLILETWTASAIGLVNILNAAFTVVPDARVLNAASGECFGETSASNPASDRTRFNPRSPYAAAKCGGHYAVQAARAAFGQFACSAFLFNHESPLRPETFVTAKVAAAVRRIASGSDERLRLGSVSIVRDWGWAPEYVEAMRLMLQQPEPQDMVVATGRSHSLAEFVELAFRAADLDWRAHVDTGTGPSRPGDPAAQHADSTRARRFLGWEARVGLCSIAEWLVDGRLY